MRPLQPGTRNPTVLLPCLLAKIRELQEAFPGAEFILDEAGLAETVAKAVALVDAPHLASDLTLDLRGTQVE